MGSDISIRILPKYRVGYLSILYLVGYCYICYNYGMMEEVYFMPEGRKTTEAQKRAKQKYMERFVEIKVRMTPERRAEVQAHAQSQGESATAFINRAIDEQVKRDNGE